MNRYDNTLRLKLNADRCIERLYCNVIVIVDGSHFHCHRFILAIASRYFDTMFRTQFIEKSCKEVAVYGPFGSALTAQTMKLVLKYIYTEKLYLCQENIFDILCASDYLEMDQLKEKCVDYLCINLTGTTWANCFNLAQKLCLARLHTACTNQFYDIFNDIDFVEMQSPKISTVGGS